MWYLLQSPIVVDVIKQPAATAAISYGSVLLSALYVVGILFLAGNVVGLAAGAAVVFYKRWRDAGSPDAPEPSHTRLRLN